MLSFLTLNIIHYINFTMLLKNIERQSAAHQNEISEKSQAIDLYS